MNGRRASSRWRWLFCLVVAYICFEGWAQYRFIRQNVYMPMGIRANMGADFYEAFKLRANFCGLAPIGHLFLTDPYGFRIAPDPPSHLLEIPTLLIGGDSRIFGYSLSWDQGFVAHLQKHYRGPIHLQAFPGGSPALFNHEMWTLGLFDRLQPKPEVVVYDYDRDDGYGDRSFKQQSAQPQWRRSLTHFKLALGGYGISRAQAIFRSFWRQWQEPFPESWRFAGFAPGAKSVAPADLAPKLKTGLEEQQHTPDKADLAPTLKTGLEEQQTQLGKADYSTPLTPSQPGWQHQRSIPIERSELLLMRDACQQRGVRLIVLYQPRLVELVARDSKMRDELEKVCSDLGIRFLETFTTIDTSLNGGQSDLYDWFSDPNEGIHLTPKALELTANKLLGHLEAGQK